MTVHEGLYARLAADATLVGLVGTRMWPVWRAQNSAFPALTYRLMEEVCEYGLWDMGVVRHAVWEIDCYGESFAGARAVAERVHVLLDRFRGTLGGAFVLHTLQDAQKEEGIELNGVEIVRVRYWFRMAYQA